MNDNNLNDNVVQNDDMVNNQETQPIQDVNNISVSNTSVEEQVVDNTQQNNDVQIINSGNVLTQNNNAVNSSNIVDSKKKNRLPIIIGVLILVLLILFVGGFIFLTNKKTVVKNEVSSVFKEARKNLKNLEDNTLIFSLNDDKVGMSGSLAVKSDYKNDGIDLTNLEKYKISYNGVIAKKDNEASLSFELADEKNIINSKIYAKGKKVYINLGDVLEKVIAIDTDTEIKNIEINDVNIKDYDLLLSKAEKIIIGNIDDKDISKTQEEKEFNGKKKKYTKVSYNIKIGKQIKLVLNGYKDDKEVVKVLSKMYNLSEKDIIKKLDESAKNIDENYGDGLNLNVYLDGILNTTCGLEIADDNDSIIADVKGSVYTYKFLSDDKEVGHGVLDLDNNKFTFISKSDYNTFNFKMDWNKKNALNGNIKLTSDSMNINFDFNINNKVNDKSMSTDFTGKLNAEISGEKFNFEINGDYSIIKDAKVEQFDTSNAISSDQLTDEDTMNAYNNIMNKLKPILNEISPDLGNSLDMNLLPSSYDNYDVEDYSESLFRKLF